MAASEIAAWWGAIIATALLVWDIIKWSREGARLDLSVIPNMEAVGMIALGQKKGTTYISIRIRNYGNLPTTITNIGFKHFKNRFDFIRRHPSSQWLIPLPAFAKPLPCIVAPGEIWDGAAIQDSQVEKLMANGLLVCYVWHSTSNKPIYSRIKPKKKLCKNVKKIEKTD
jgi:hypothetical protein